MHVGAEPVRQILHEVLLVVLADIVGTIDGGHVHDMRERGLTRQRFRAVRADGARIR